MFRKNILLKIEEINDNIKGIRSTTSNDSSIFSEDVLKDHNEGTETHEVEKSFLLISRESDYVTNLQKALHRVDNGTYGICQIYQDDPEMVPSTPLPAVGTVYNASYGKLDSDAYAGDKWSRFSKEVFMPSVTVN